MTSHFSTIIISVYIRIICVCVDVEDGSGLRERAASDHCRRY